MSTNVVPFREVLSRLMDTDQPFPAKLLHYFSDLSCENETLLADIWNRLPIARKLSILEDLEGLSEHDTLVDFRGTGRIAIKDDDATVRESALHVLWDCEDKAFIQEFIDLLKTDSNARVRASCAAILGRYVFLGETDALSGTYQKRVEEALLESYQSDADKLVRRRALESLGYSSREEIAHLIQQAVDLNDPEWLSSGLFAMGRSADSTWDKSVIRYLQNPVDTVREEAVRAAGELELVEARVILIGMLDEETDDDIRAAIIWSLSQIGGDGVRDALNKLVKSCREDDMADILEEALDNLDFTEELTRFDLLDLDDRIGKV